MDRSWEGLALSQDGETVVESGDIVLWGGFGGMKWFVALEWLGWVRCGSLKSSSVCINSIEDSSQDSRV